jgi:hypothetical protein
MIVNPHLVKIIYSLADVTCLAQDLGPSLVGLHPRDTKVSYPSPSVGGITMSYETPELVQKKIRVRVINFFYYANYEQILI